MRRQKLVSSRNVNVLNCLLVAAVQSVLPDAADVRRYPEEAGIFRHLEKQQMVFRFALVAG